MAQDNIPKSVKEKIKEWEKKSNMSNNPPKNTKPTVPPKPTSEKIKARDEGHKKQTYLTTHSQALDIFVDTTSPQKGQEAKHVNPTIITQQQKIARTTQHDNAPQKPTISPNSTSEQEKRGAIRSFLTNSSIELHDFGVEDLFHYVSSTKNTQNPNRVNSIINTYDRTLSNIVKAIDVNNREQFMNLMENLIEEHPHKDKFERINRLYKDITHSQIASEETHKPQSNLTVKEKIERFFKNHNIDTKDALIPEFSRYIELSGSMAGKRLDVTVKAYEQSLGRLIKQVEVPQKEFISFIEDDLIKNHPHKDKFEKINQHYKLPEPPKLSDIIDNLRELVNSDDIIANLKQSSKHIEFKEKVTNIIQIYDDNKHNPSAIAKVETRLKEVGKWCEETTKMDNTPIWKNIGNFIKYSFTGDKTKAAFYKDAIKNSTQNTKKAIAEIQKSLTNPSSNSSSVPPKNKGERYRS